MWVLQFGFAGGRADGGSAPSDHPDVRPPNDNLGAFYLAVCPSEPYKLGRGVKSVQHPLNIDMVTQGRVSRDSADVWLEAGPDGTVRPMLLPTKSKMLQLNQKPVSQQKHAMVLVDGDRITLCKQNYAVVKHQPLVLCVSSKLPSAERAKVDLAVQQLEELTKSKITVVHRMKQGVTHYVSQSIPGGLSSSLLDVLCMCVPVVTFEFVEDLVKIVKGRKPIPSKLDDYWPNTTRLSTRMSNSRSLTSQHSTHLTLGKSVRVNLAVCPWRTTLLKGYTVVLAMSSPTAAKCFYRIMEKMGAVELLLLSTIADQVEVSERLKPQCSSVVIFYDDSVDPCWDAFKRIQMNDLGIGIASGAKELFFEQPPSDIDQQGDDDFKTLPTIKEEPVTQVSATSQHKRAPSLDLSPSSTVPKRAKLEEDQENLSAADISLKTERPPPLVVAGSRPNKTLKSDEVVFDSGSDSEDGKVLLAMSTRQKRKLDDLSAARKKPALTSPNVKKEPVAESDKEKVNEQERKRTRRSLSLDPNQATVAGNIKSESSGEPPTASTTTAVSVKLEDESGHAQESSFHDEAWPHQYDSDDDDYDDQGENKQNKQNASIDRGGDSESHLYVCARDEIEPEKADKLWKELEKQCQALLEPKVSEPAQPRRRFRKNKVLRAREERPDEEISWELYKFDENDCAAVRKIGEELIKEEERMHQAFIDLNDMGSSASMGKLRDVLPESGSTAGAKRRTAAKGRTRVSGRANRT